MLKKDLIPKGCGIAAQILLLPLGKRLQRKARTKVDQSSFDFSPKKLVLIIKDLFTNHTIHTHFTGSY